MGYLIIFTHQRFLPLASLFVHFCSYSYKATARNGRGELKFRTINAYFNSKRFLENVRWNEVVLTAQATVKGN